MSDVETETLDMREAVDEFDEKISQLEQEAQELRDELDGETDPQETDEGMRIQSEYGTAKNRYEALSDYVRKWNGSEFVVQKLTFGQTMNIQDEVNKRSQMDIDMSQANGFMREGFYKVATVREAVVNSPEGSPSDPANYPMQIGLWLYDKIDEINTASEVDLGNLWDETEEND
jgi:predicted  nucleic acid-binding Zn-ribbon protein